jgi:hypothetical protein
MKVRERGRQDQKGEPKICDMSLGIGHGIISRGLQLIWLRL